jgi:hypothetical protein
MNRGVAAAVRHDRSDVVEPEAELAVEEDALQPVEVSRPRSGDSPRPDRSLGVSRPISS